jgi:hypothetical protein
MIQAGFWSISPWRSPMGSSNLGHRGAGRPGCVVRLGLRQHLLAAVGRARRARPCTSSGCRPRSRGRVGAATKSTGAALDRSRVAGGPRLQTQVIDLDAHGWSAPRSRRRRQRKSELVIAVPTSRDSCRTYDDVFAGGENPFDPAHARECSLDPRRSCSMRSAASSRPT